MKISNWAQPVEGVQGLCDSPGVFEHCPRRSLVSGLCVNVTWARGLLGLDCEAPDTVPWVEADFSGPYFLITEKTAHPASGGKSEQGRVGPVGVLLALHTLFLLTLSRNFLSTF